MKDRVIVKTLPGKESEIVDRARNFGGKKLADNIAFYLS